MSISPSYVDGLELRIKELGEQVEKLTGLVVMRFDHDVPPQFSQGYSEHEMVEPVTAEHCKWFVGEIVALREQVEKLTESYDQCGRTVQEYGRTITQTELRLHEVATHCVNVEEQLAALAEQNEKMRVALQAMVDEAFARNCGLKIADDALSLPDLASPVLNRIRADGVRKASTFISLVRNDWASAGDNLSVQAAEYLISALDTRATELEKTNG